MHSSGVVATGGNGNGHAKEHMMVFTSKKVGCCFILLCLRFCIFLFDVTARLTRILFSNVVNFLLKIIIH